MHTNKVAMEPRVDLVNDETHSGLQSDGKGTSPSMHELPRALMRAYRLSR